MLGLFDCLATYYVVDQTVICPHCKDRDLRASLLWIREDVELNSVGSKYSTFEK